MRKSVLMKAMTLMAAGAMILSAPFSSFAAEMGEVSVGEPPIMEEEIEFEPDIIVPVEEPIVGGRSERLAYLGCMRYYFGEERPLWEYAEWLITEEGWDPNSWIWELLAELYPDESLIPEPIPAPDEPLVFDDDAEADRESVVTEPNQAQENDEWVEISEPVTLEVNGTQITIHHMGKDSSDEPKPEPAPQIPDDPTAVQYVVARGDSLWKIAETFYGDGYRWIDIYHANREIIANPGQIYTGQALIVPGIILPQ